LMSGVLPMLPMKPSRISMERRLGITRAAINCGG